jgi:hypothetical protein
VTGLDIKYLTLGSYFGNITSAFDDKMGVLVNILRRHLDEIFWSFDVKGGRALT